MTKTGRPSKPATPGQRASLGLKVTADIKERLDQAARQNGRTQSQEAEVRLERSFIGREDLLSEALRLAYGPQAAGLLLMLARAMVDTGRDAAIAKSGLDQQRNWLSEPYAFGQAVRAAHAILMAARPAGDATAPDYAQAARAWGWSKEQVERMERYGEERPHSLVIELIRAIKGEPRKDWFVDDAARIRDLIGPMAGTLVTPELTAEVIAHDAELATADAKRRKKRGA